MRAFFSKIEHFFFQKRAGKASHPSPPSCATLIDITTALILSLRLPLALSRTTLVNLEDIM